MRSRRSWGGGGEPASTILAQVNEDNLYSFDQACRVKALQLPVHLGLPSRAQHGVSINFLPQAIYEPANCLRVTLETAGELGLPLGQIIFELTEHKRATDIGRIGHIMTEYHRFGLRTAIDDFGGDYSGLNLLTEFQPQILKLDLHLTRGIDMDATRRAIVAGIVHMCGSLASRRWRRGSRPSGRCARFWRSASPACRLFVRAPRLRAIA
ncbi:EAL domain-containing protein [Aquabacter sp. L1I39]|uniref:EAL domain-containing protein n=1 Tax=Aquabacter sp. L1I39 TaxID=2820278 RepID=UPI001AD95D27|nr:EAL domain-containing protein [Aquabacter sp. L1I39]QTL05343.1 EAL domain-containing protein [Aquabacter sp. L1I39]